MPQNKPKSFIPDAPAAKAAAKPKSFVPDGPRTLKPGERGYAAQQGAAKKPGDTGYSVWADAWQGVKKTQLGAQLLFGPRALLTQQNLLNIVKPQEPLYKQPEEFSPEVSTALAESGGMLPKAVTSRYSALQHTPLLDIETVAEKRGAGPYTRGVAAGLAGFTTLEQAEMMAVLPHSRVIAGLFGGLAGKGAIDLEKMAREADAAGDHEHAKYLRGHEAISWLGAGLGALGTLSRGKGTGGLATPKPPAFIPEPETPVATKVGQPSPLVKAAKIEEARVSDNPEWTAAEVDHILARVKAVQNNPKATPEELQIAASMEATVREQFAKTQPAAPIQKPISEMSLEEAKAALAGLKEPEVDFGPQPTKVRPGQELPRRLGGTIRSKLPTRTPVLEAAEAVAATPEVARVEVATAKPTAVKTTPIRKSDPANLPKDLESTLKNIRKFRDQPQAVGMVTDLQKIANAQLRTYRNGLGADIETAATVTHARVEKLAEQINYFERSVNTWEKWTAQVAAQNAVRSTGTEAAFTGEGTVEIHLPPRTLPSGKIVGGNTITVPKFHGEGPSLAAREIMAKAEGKRRVLVPNVAYAKKVQKAVAEGREIPTDDASLELIELKKLYDQRRTDIAQLVKDTQSTITEEQHVELKALEEKLTLSALRSHGNPTREKIALATGVSVETLKDVPTGAGKAVAVDVNRAFSVMTQKLMESVGHPKGAKFDKAIAEAKLQDLRGQKDQLEKIAALLDAGAMKRAGERGSVGDKEEGFYSFLERVLRDKLPNRSTPEQLANTLRNAGVNKQEIEGTSLDTLLLDAKASGRSLSKNEVLNFIEANKMKLEVTEKVARSIWESMDAQYIELQQTISVKAEEAKAALRAVGLTDAQARDVLEAQTIHGMKESKELLEAGIGRTLSSEEFAPHLERFIELERLMDLEDAQADFAYRDAPKYETYTLPGGENYRELLIRKPGRPDLSDIEVAKLSPEARHEYAAEDYHSPHFDEPNILAHLRVKDRISLDNLKTLMLEEVQTDGGKVNPETGKTVWEDQTRQPFPLPGTWHELALKYALKEAVEKGYDQIAWTTGEQQAQRYSLRQHFDRLSYSKNSDGTYDIGLLKPGERLGQSTHSFSNRSPDDLRALIDKDLADKIIRGDSEFTYPGRNKANNGPETLHGFLINKAIGGEHHLRLYDEMVPQFLNRYTKKWGGRVGETQIEIPEQKFIDFAGQDSFKQKYSPATKVHSLRITPEMRRAILNDGQRLIGGYSGTRLLAGMATGGITGAATGSIVAGLVGGLVGSAVGTVLGGIAAAKYDRVLGPAGLKVMPTPKDLGWVARYFGSLTQQAGKVSLDAGRAADLMSAGSKTLTKLTEDYVTPLKDVVKNIGKKDFPKLAGIIEKTSDAPLDNPNMQIAVDLMRQTFENVRQDIVASRRRADLRSGMKPEDVEARTPSDWGIKDFWPHMFEGDWTLTRQEGKDFRPVETNWRFTDRDSAVRAAIEYDKINPGAVMKLERDTISAPATGSQKLSGFRKLLEDMKKESKLEGPALDEAILDWKDRLGGIAYGKERQARRQFGHAMQRKSNLPGWLNTPEAVETYLRGAARYVVMNELRPQLLELRNKVAQDISREAPITKISEMPRRHRSRMLGSLDASIEAFEGYPNRFETAMREGLGAAGLDPRLFDRMQGIAMEVEAMLKLGFSPMSALTNMTQTVTNTFPVLGPKWTRVGIQGFVSGKYRPHLEEAGIKSQLTKMEVEDFSEYTVGYRGVRHASLYLFKEAEYANRVVAWVGAYERAKAGGLSETAAKEAASTLLDRTHFNYEQFDKPAVLRALPKPVAQFKTFAFKQAEFITSLRGEELGRFLLVAMPILGVSALVGYDTLNGLVQGGTDKSIEEHARKKDPLLARMLKGVPGLAGVDVTRNVAFADAFSPDIKQLAGPLASDLYNLAQASPQIMHDLTGFPPGSREHDAALRNFLNGLSPQARRTYNFFANPDIMKDPRTGNVIMRGITPMERLLLAVGMTPIRVAEERDLNQEVQQRQITKQDRRGYIVDELAKTVLDGRGASTETRADNRKYMRQLMQEAIANGYAENIQPAIESRIKDMILDRKMRNLLRSPQALRPEVLERYRDLEGE